MAYSEEQGLKNVVFSVNWLCSAVDANDNTASLSGTHLIPFSGSKDFTPAENLDLATVVGWLQAAMGDLVQSTITSQLDELVKEKAQPAMVELSMSWMA
jgi:hypothetical protein